MPTYIEEKRIQIIKFVQERQTTLASGLAALLIIVVGFLIFNFFLNVNKDNSPETNTANVIESTESAEITILTPTSTPTVSKTPTPTIVKETAKSDSSGQVSSNGAAAVTLPQTYTIVRGDTLGKIAQKFYNDSSYWSQISKANDLSNPSLIHAGNKLTLPKIETANAVATSKPPTSITPATSVKSGGGNVEYVVSRGETLWGIAINFYGSGFEWYRIKNANPKIGTLANGRPLIYSGQHLIIP